MTTLLGALVLFGILTLTLALLRPRLLLEFVGISLLLFGTQLPGKWVYSLLFLPGTILHELSHYLTAELLGVRTGKIELLPDFESGSDSEKLGSVSTAQTGPLRSFAIGAAPFFTGLLSLWVLGTLLPQSWLWWQYLGIFYGIVVIGSSMLLSREDRRAWPFLGIIIAFLITLFTATPLDIPPRVLVLISQTMYTLDQVLGVTVGAILAIIGLVSLMRRIIERILGKKIVRR